MKLSPKIEPTRVMAPSGVGRMMVPIRCGTIGGRVSWLSLWICARTNISWLEAVITHGRSRRRRETIEMGIIIPVVHGFWFDWAQQGLHPSSRHTVSRISGSTTTSATPASIFRMPILLRLLLWLWLGASFLSRQALCSARMPFFVGIAITKVTVCPPRMRFPWENCLRMGWDTVEFCAHLWAREREIQALQFYFWDGCFRLQRGHLCWWDLDELISIQQMVHLSAGSSIS